jgi:hypothetical protein
MPFWCSMGWLPRVADLVFAGDLVGIEVPLVPATPAEPGAGL